MSTPDNPNSKNQADEKERKRELTVNNIESVGNIERLLREKYRIEYYFYPDEIRKLKKIILEVIALKTEAHERRKKGDFNGWWSLEIDTIFSEVMCRFFAEYQIDLMGLKKGEMHRSKLVEAFRLLKGKRSID